MMINEGKSEKEYSSKWKVNSYGNEKCVTYGDNLTKAIELASTISFSINSSTSACH
jgi:hypothetical protein